LIFLPLRIILHQTVRKNKKHYVTRSFGKTRVRKMQKRQLHDDPQQKTG